MRSEIRFASALKVAILMAVILCCSSARASEYSLILFETKAELHQRNDSKGSAAYWERFNTYAGMLAKAGVLRGGSAFDETTTRSVVAGEALPPSAADAALSPSGYFVIDVATVEEAEAWAKKINTQGRVEVRPHRPNPTMNDKAK